MRTIKTIVLLFMAMCAAVAVSATEPLVKEGKVWSHIAYEPLSEEPNSGAKKWMPEMYFEGKCERFGKEYTVLRTSPVDTLALMRQDGDRVYLLLDENFMSRYDFCDYFSRIDNLDDFKNTEALVYDFSIDKRGEYTGIAYIWEENMIVLNYETYIWDVDEIIVNGETLRRQQADMMINMIPGYGSSDGMCLIPQFPRCSYECGPRLEVHHIIDKETREEIFTYEDFFKPAVGVEEIPAEQPSDGVQAKPKDNKMYDLNGREIRNPLPGTVYIQNGEKHVAK